jgi:peptide/nickel transport system ATP-binding protein
MLRKNIFYSRFLWEKSGFKAVNDVSFKLYDGETLGISREWLRKINLGECHFTIRQSDFRTDIRGQDITKLGNAELKKTKKEIHFQDPYSSLNPRIPVGKTIMEPMKVHGLYKNDKEKSKKTIEILERVGLGAEYFNRYPHEFSGGQRQHRNSENYSVAQINRL